MPEILRQLPLLLLLPRLLLALDLLDAEFDLGVEPEGAARLEKQLVDAPVLEVVLGDEGTEATCEVQSPASVDV